MTQAIPILLQPHGKIPNNPRLPVLLYRQVYTGGDNLESRFKDAFKQNDWAGSWMNGVFNYHHFHSRSHEVLGVAAGSAMLILGGPGGTETEIMAGDMVVLPAGTGHCRKSATADFKVVGAYPKGQEDYDICTKDDNVEEKKANIAKVPLPSTDPLFGVDGPLMLHWK